MTGYTERLKQSWLWEELYHVRNIRPSFHKRPVGRHRLFGVRTFVLRGKAPWTFQNHADHLQLKKASEAPKIQYPKPDGVLTFDRLSSVFISNTNHEENQPPRTGACQNVETHQAAAVESAPHVFVGGHSRIPSGEQNSGACRQGLGFGSAGGGGRPVSDHCICCFFGKAPADQPD